MDSPKSNLKPEWLKETQLKSWEPEILLSGIVLYGMFQVPDALDSFLFFFDNEVFNYINAMELFIAIMKVGVYWLIVGLILHLICRGLWIGLVGLDYSFPKGIQFDKLKFQPKFLEKVKEVPPFEAIILKLEHICSFIYSVSFLLFMSLVGTCIYTTVLILLPMSVVMLTADLRDESLVEALNAYAQYVLLFGLLGVLDFVTMGFFRRFRIPAFVLWPIYRLFSFLTLAKYYRPTYFARVTNLNRWWLFLFLLVFTFLSYVGIGADQSGGPRDTFSLIDVWSFRDGDESFEGHYQDKGSDNPSIRMQIPSDIIRDDVLRVFIPARINVEDSLKKFMNYDSILDLPSDSLNLGQYYLSQISKFYRISVADSTFETKMYFQVANSTKQRGYLTYLNVGYLSEGLYEIHLEGPSEMYEEPFAIVPFYKLKE